MEIMFQASLLTKTIWAVFILSGMALILIYLFPGRVKPPKGPVAHGLIEAVIQDYLPNKSGDIDKIVVSTNNAEQILHFPPHTASYIMQRFGKGDTVKVNLEPGKHGPGKSPELISIQKNEQLLMVKAIHPAEPAPADSVNLSISEYKVQADDKDNITGIITSEYFIPLPPHLLRSSGALPKSMEIKGIVRNPNAGFVNRYGLTLLKPYSVIINNTQYIL